jgi:hypothetical protein
MAQTPLSFSAPFDGPYRSGVGLLGPLHPRSSRDRFESSLWSPHLPWERRSLMLPKRPFLAMARQRCTNWAVDDRSTQPPGALDFDSESMTQSRWILIFLWREPRYRISAKLKLLKNELVHLCYCQPFLRFAVGICAAKAVSAQILIREAGNAS